jgi:hypothetical protein
VFRWTVSMRSDSVAAPKQAVNHNGGGEVEWRIGKKRLFTFPLFAFAEMGPDRMGPSHVN